MDNTDLLQEVLYNIDLDVKSLGRSCAVNKSTREICSTKYYWSKIFEEQKLKMPNINYTTPIGWIKEYEKERKLQLYIKQLLIILKNPTIDDFYGTSHPLDLDALYINGDHFPFNNLTNIKGIDIEYLSQHWNTWLLDQIKYMNASDDEYEDTTPQILISYIKGI